MYIYKYTYVYIYIYIYIYVYIYIYIYIILGVTNMTKYDTALYATLRNKKFQLIDFVSNRGNKTFIKVSAKGSVSGSRKVKGWIGFACNSLKTAVNGI